MAKMNSFGVQLVHLGYLRGWPCREAVVTLRCLVLHVGITNLRVFQDIISFAVDIPRREKCKVFMFQCFHVSKKSSKKFVSA